MCSRQYVPVTRLPTRRPCRSGKATRTVSIRFSAIASSSIAASSIPRTVMAAQPIYSGVTYRGGDAAVDDELGPGHVRGVVGGEEGRARPSPTPPRARAGPSGCAPCAGQRAQGSERSSSSRGVWIGPGHNEFARMPWRAYSTAIYRVIDSTPPSRYSDLHRRRPISATKRSDVDDAAAARCDHRGDPGPAPRTTRP